MPYDLGKFDLRAMLACGLALRREIEPTTTLEDSANVVVRHFHENCIASDGERSCVLVRFYKTHPFGKLEPGLQTFARQQLDSHELTPTTRCLTLLATVGSQKAWNSRQRSRRHKVIPLPSADIVEKAPMIARLIDEFGLELGAVVGPAGEVVAERGNRTYNVFHVEQARGSPYIPAQDDFVIPFGIESVVGIGGSLMTGDLFAVIIFSRIRIPKASAERLRNVALDIKASIFRFGEDEGFASAESDESQPPQPAL